MIDLVVFYYFYDIVLEIKVNLLTLSEIRLTLNVSIRGCHFLPRNSACAPRHLATCTRCVEVDGVSLVLQGNSQLESL